MFSVEHVNRIRLAEIGKVAAMLPAGARVLEIGGGTGVQARELNRRGFDAVAIELADSTYSAHRVFPVTEYDGRRIPFPDASFDAVFSSNVLEHVADLDALQAEIKRVLKPDGICVHVLPSHLWRFWTIVSSYPNALVCVAAAVAARGPAAKQAWRDALRQAAVAAIQPRHGERGIGYAELWLFHPRWWRRYFGAHGFVVTADEPMGFFYTGNMLFGLRWDMEKRKTLARYLGSGSHLYRLIAR